MLVIPAVDIRGGRCVRLTQGNPDNETVYDAHPAAHAARFADAGAERIHVVDLDAAIGGGKDNRQGIRELIDEVGGRARIQVGGGLRNLQMVEECINLGADYAVVGTAAVQNPQFFREVCHEFGEQILLAIDARDGMIATHGWKKVTMKRAVDFVANLADHAIGAIIYTDIGRDGTMSGPNVEATVEIAGHSDVPVIASGGVRNLEDVQSLLADRDNGISGVIVGKALYETGTSVADLVAWAKNARGTAA